MEARNVILADKFDRDPAAFQRLGPIEPLGVGRLQDWWLLRMGASDGDELPVWWIEHCQICVVGKAVETSNGMFPQWHLVHAPGVGVISQRPFNEGIAGPIAGLWGSLVLVYSAHVRTRKSFGLMIRKLSVTRSQ
jgi:hypothetical protein